jgi:outer membrane protein assembly factor BamB
MCGLVAVCLLLTAECLGQSRFTIPAAEFQNRSSLVKSFEVTLEAPLVGPAVLDGARAYLAEPTSITAITLTGERQWHVTTDVAWPIAVADSLVVAAGNHSIVLLRAEDGSPRWSVSLKAPIAVAPAFRNGMIFVGLTTGELVALRAGDGAVVWTHELAHPPVIPIVASDVAVFAASSSGAVVGVEIDTGRTRWVRRLPAAAASMAVVETGLLVIGGSDKCLYALRTTNGGNRWPRRRIGARPAGPAVGDTRNLYYVALDNILWALNRRTGDVRWRQLLPRRPLGGPVILGQTLAVSVVGPEFYLFAKNGAQLAAFSSDVAEARGVAVSQQADGTTSYVVTSARGQARGLTLKHLVR